MIRGPIQRLSSGDGYTGWFLEPIEEWSQFSQACNWRTFHPFHLELEDDRLMGGVEATLILAGLGFRVRWNYARTEVVADIDERISEILRDSPPSHPQTVAKASKGGGEC